MAIIYSATLCELSYRRLLLTSHVCIAVDDTISKHEILISRAFYSPPSPTAAIVTITTTTRLQSKCRTHLLAICRIARCNHHTPVQRTTRFYAKYINVSTSYSILLRILSPDTHSIP